MLILNSKGINTTAGATMLANKLNELGYSSLSNMTLYCVTHPGDEVETFILKNAVEIMGFSKENIVFSMYEVPDASYNPDIVYVSEGNTLELLAYMRKFAIDKFIVDWYQNKNKIYIGSSAGAAIAGSDITLSKFFNSNYVRMYDFKALGLFDGAILPHLDEEHFNMFIENLEEKYLLDEYDGNLYHVDNSEVIVFD